MLRTSQHRAVPCFRHRHYAISLNTPWRHFRVTSEPWRCSLLMLSFTVYPLHSPYSHPNLHCINNLSTHYQTILSPLLKENQRPHMHDAMSCYYTTLLYTYLKLFASRFYECIMMTVSPVTSILQKHSSYYRAITDSSKCLLMSNNTLLHAISVLVLNLLDT
jgi:hypothetical protein